MPRTRRSLMRHKESKAAAVSNDDDGDSTATASTVDSGASPAAHTPARRRRRHIDVGSAGAGAGAGANGGSIASSPEDLHGVQDRLLEALEQVKSMQDAKQAADYRVQQKVRLLAGTFQEAIDERVADVQSKMADNFTDLKADLMGIIRDNVWSEATQPQTPKTSAKARRRARLYSQKVFRRRPSVLSVMLRDKDFQTIYNIAVTCLIWLGVNVLLTEYVDGKPIADFSIFTWSFSNLGIVFFAWILMFGTSMGSVWLVQAIVACNAPVWLYVWPYLGMHAFICTTGLYTSLNYRLNPASGLIVMCECARFVMKTHGYVREKLLHGTNQFTKYRNFIPAFAREAGVTEVDLHHPDITIGDLPTELARYMYYMFVPTLVYRDSYPVVGPHVRWLKVFTHLLNVIGCIMFTFIIFRSFCIPYFKASASQEDLLQFVLLIFRSMVPSTFTFLLAFFGLLHSWFNLFGELMRYGDRQFYVDWWNARSFGQFYRRWNIVVHEWLYYYLYQDVMRATLGRIGRRGAMLLVFVLSALFHEFVLAGGLGFLYPVLLAMFGGPGVVFVWLTRTNARWFNLFMWLMLSVGLGILMVLYSREWFARFGNLAPPVEDLPQGWLGFVVPHSLPKSWYPHFKFW